MDAETSCWELCFRLDVLEKISFSVLILNALKLF